MRLAIYNALVNRKPGISYRYHRFHDGSTGFKKFVSWIYLLWLNFAYYVLFCHFLGAKPDAEFYESKCIPSDISESELARKSGPMPVSELVKKLSEYDIISFDVFDTLIFRPFSEPADLFYFVGEKLGIQDFKNLRINAESRARQIVHKASEGYEVTLEQIWEGLERETGLSAKEGIRIETETERNLCFANPYMLEVWNELINAGKKLIIVSDMYLPADTINGILEKNGFAGADRIYISNEFGINKYEGRLYAKVKEDINKDIPNAKIIHVGDNPRSDHRMAIKSGFESVLYPNVGRMQLSYRPYDMSSIVGSAYRGIVNSHIYNGLETFSMEYEYGFIYGGLFVLGYCRFIHDCFVNEKQDKVLFLSRDGKTLKKVYDMLYPDDNAEYVHWSRKAAVKLMAPYDKHDYFRRFIDHKTSLGITVSEVLDSMEVSHLTSRLSGKISGDEVLTTENAGALKKFLNDNWADVIKAYEEQQNAAKAFFTGLLSGCSKAVCIDIGWAGSGALSISYLCEKVWNIPCSISGIIAGTNTPYNSEPDASEAFLQSGKLKSFLFSQSFNRDLLKKHDPGKDYNVFWELLLSSDEPCFEGYYPDGEHYSESDIDGVKAKEIERGVVDFALNYKDRFKEYPYMYNISGRDAYAPMLAAAGNRENYLHAIASHFELEKGLK
ncbi:MAG: hypothetical protein KBG42_09775 [Lachnospiraceae bacterium]|nr:hypothetical protein [Lachnospiraceae bacterium]